jgi:hypothetical protein
MKFWKALSPGLRAFLTGIAILAVMLCIGLLSGCASGVQMTDEETVRCRNEGCAAFTLGEIRILMGKVFKDGYLSGWTDSNRQGGRDL